MQAATSNSTNRCDFKKCQLFEFQSHVPTLSYDCYQSFHFSTFNLHGSSSKTKTIFWQKRYRLTARPNPRGRGKITLNFCFHTSF